MPKPAAMRARWRPLRPKPTMSSRLPQSSLCSSRLRQPQSPLRTARSLRIAPLGGGQKQHHRLLGDGYRIHVPDDRQRDAALIERSDIDRVVPDAVPRDDAEPIGLADGLGRKGLRADDEPVGRADQRRIARLGNLLDIVERHVGSRTRSSIPLG